MINRKKYMLAAAAMALSVSLGLPQAAAAAEEPEKNVIHNDESEKAEDLSGEMEKPTKAASDEDDKQPQTLPKETAKDKDSSEESSKETGKIKASAEEPSKGTAKDKDSSEKTSKETRKAGASSEESSKKIEELSEEPSGKAGESSEALSGKEDVDHLQIPQKMQVVIDPWEMDGKGQIYSEEYIVKNTGQKPGLLTLSDLACEAGEGSGVTVTDDARGLHDNAEKSIYMEVILGDDDKIVLSREGVAYEAEILPGEELRIWFSGEVNENAEESWKDGDIGVRVTYSWEQEEATDETMEDADTAETAKDTEVRAEEKSADTDETEAGLKPEKKESELLELKEAVQSELTVDSWEIDENGNICSAQYRIRNAGDAAGTFTLSEFLCKLAEQSGITVRTDKEKLHEDENKYIYMELAPEGEQKGEAERVVILPELLPEEPEVSEYLAELKPGEELVFRFVGELNGMKSEELKKGDITVTASYSWSMEETAPEDSES